MLTSPPPPPATPVPQSYYLGIYNNIIYGNFALSGKGDDLSLFEGGFRYLDVYLFNNDFSDLVHSYEGNFDCQPVEGNNINADPLFVDADAGDFGLMPDSACIDSGDPNAPDLPETDIFGNPRGPIPDMGAVEYIAEAANNGGCSLTHAPAASRLAVFLVIPVLILIRRVLKRKRSS